MEVTRPKTDKTKIVYATERKLGMIESCRKRLSLIDEDPRKEDRLKHQECLVCYYWPATLGQ